MTRILCTAGLAWIAFNMPVEAQRAGGMMSTYPVMKALDVDGDGELSAEEIDNAPTALRYLDDDGNGVLSTSELAPGFASDWGDMGDWDDMGDWGGMDDWDDFGERRREAGGGELVEPADLDFNDGTATVADRETFKRLSYQQGMVMPHLKGLEFVKFQIEDADTDDPKLYFMNTRTHPTHITFMRAIGKGRGSWGMRGVLVHRPFLMAPSGKPGLYTFEFDLADAYPFEMIKIAHDLLETNSPLLKGNLAYHPLPRATDLYTKENAQYEAASLPVFLPGDRYADIGFLPLNLAESFGRLRLMRLDERPSPRDIVIYPTLPNEMPRVAGIITGVRQTPLSHVNLRAIQDSVPNAFVTGPADNETIAALIGKYVYYKVAADGYEIQEATIEEVNAHFAAARPAQPQVPVRDLSVTEIRSLDQIQFDDLSSVGVKAANLATLRTVGFPDGLIPRGFAVPFHFYDAFMKHNGFYEKAVAMRNAPVFADTDKREAALADFRHQIEKGNVPAWMTEAFSELQRSLPEKTPLRCRSSTNNEDLPGFSGAGLYDSFTHHANEGHLSKSIKQVYASLWNFRAYEEREFHRIDHFASAMGVLVHPNFSDERANGVAVTEDIVYQTGKLETGRMYYINTQIGEDLVTNPEGESIPEEILLSPRFPCDDIVVRRSNRFEDGKPILSPQHLGQLRMYLKTIHREFRSLYGKKPDAQFAMEVEFKVTADGRLAIKQARPWVF